MLPQGNDMFTHMLNNYNQMRNMMNESAAPMMKLMAPNASKASMDMMNDLSNEFAQYQIKNAQMQYMMYTTGMKAMEDVAEQVYTKMRNGEDMSSFLKIYQEWLNTNDKHFVSLFSTDEYSKMQAEVNTLGMKMKRHMDTQMEKMLNHIPVATRTEMDELYKTIYELKKRVNTLEKQIDTDEPIVAEEKEAKKGKSAKNA
jgi:predicted nuclease with TOPRIM domain